MDASEHIANAKRLIIIAEADDSRAAAWEAVADEIIAAFDAGMTYTAIASELGRSLSWVQGISASRRKGLERPFGNETRSRPREEVSASKVLSEPVRRERVIAELPSETLDEIARAANTELNERAKTGTGLPRPPMVISQRPSRSLYHLLLNAVTAIDALYSAIEEADDLTALNVEPDAIVSADRANRRMGEIYAAIRESVNEASYTGEGS